MKNPRFSVATIADSVCVVDSLKNLMAPFGPGDTRVAELTAKLLNEGAQNEWIWLPMPEGAGL